ncbi:MAG: hypothetical protein Ct9H90mP7_5590 [Candidatus Neomarinimicrobiota bacterium]|nr:MAG: hypothetical protein Ct9H90mP7_5590 [Candidatus Neomarinimicrobiota bacterium]
MQKKASLVFAKKMNAEIIETGKTKNLKYSQSGTEFSFMSEVFFTPLFGRHKFLKTQQLLYKLYANLKKRLKMKPYKKACLKPYGSVECKSFLTNYQSTMMLHIILRGVKAAISAAIVTKKPKTSILISFKGDKEIDLIANEISKNNSSLIISGSKNLELMSANELYSAFKKKVNPAELNKLTHLKLPK